ncbi:acyl-protein thioesterase [Colletotrichum tofieldiae]|nr:acyl-protein thioesterase [Colletotrichum tofieldiae]GKT70876.1 acyl-protein thioesterase [Colletotrichum tofieldiae]GKT94223.1 acyl-protein thioesterase [Colletotrichum tofieldiae]
MADAIESVLRERNHTMIDEHEETNLIESDDDVFESSNDESPYGWEEDKPEADPLKRALRIIREEVDLPSQQSESVPPFQKTPVFLGHGSKDDKVLLLHGQQACRVLRLMGGNVELREYCKLGHWYSEEMLQDMLEFLGSERAVPRGADEIEQRRERTS